MEEIRKIIHTINKYEKRIIEGIVISFITGWFLSSLFGKSYLQISNLSYCKDINFAKLVVMICVFSIITGIIYWMRDSVARIFMFITIYSFSVMCAISAYDIGWSEKTNNAFGRAAYLAILCFINVLAFIYVKKDIIGIIQRVKINKKCLWIISGIVAVGLFAVVAIVTVLRYKTYSNSTFDFGIFTQMYEYMKQKGTVETTCERNYLLSHFGVHFSPIFYVTLPIYMIFSSPVAIQLIQAFMIALPVLPILLLAKQYKLSNKITVAIILLYAMYPATAGGAFYDIHENCFLTALILFTIWAVEKKKNILLMIFAILTLMVKEDAFIYLAVLGAFLLFSRKDKKRGLILMLGSVAYFAIAVAVVNSFGLGIMENRFSNFYFKDEGGLFQVIQTILINPGYVLTQSITNTDISGYDKIQYLIFMLVPLGTAIFTKKKYSRYILLAPFIMINILPTYLYQHDIAFQYNFGTIALIMYVIIMNVSGWKYNRKNVWAFSAVVCASIMFFGVTMPKVLYYQNKYKDGKETFASMDAALEMIPTDASVCASGYLVPHLSKNLELYDQNHLESDKYTDYLVIDARIDTSYGEFKEILESGQYESIYKKDGEIEIYKRIN